MLRIALIAASLAAIVVPVAAAPATAPGPTDWKHIQYFDASRSELWLNLSGPTSDTSCNWTGATNVTNVNGPDYRVWGCSLNYVWAKHCTPDAQTVTFTKSLYLPGPPKDLQASLLSYGNKTLTMGIDVNGRAALTAVKSVHKASFVSKAGLFKVGMNTITVHAKKGKTRKGGCNKSGVEYGVAAQIYGLFAADLAVSAPVGGATVTGVFRGSFTVQNKGPSAASLSSVVFGAYTPKLTKISGNQAFVVDFPGADDAKCLWSYSATTYKSTSYTGYSFSCPSGELLPGQSITVTMTYEHKVQAGYFYEEWPIAWGAAGDLVDPDTSNNGGSRLQSICRNDPAKPDPRCKDTSVP